MNIKDLKFDINDLVKTVGLVGIVVGLRNDIVNEVRSNKVWDSADKRIIDFRLNELEQCCGDKLKAVSSFRHEATLPKGIEEVKPKEIDLN